MPHIVDQVSFGVIVCWNSKRRGAKFCVWNLAICRSMFRRTCEAMEKALRDGLTHYGVGVGVVVLVGVTVVRGVTVAVGVGVGVSYDKVPTRCNGGGADVKVGRWICVGAMGGVAGNNNAPMMLNTT